MLCNHDKQVPCFSYYSFLERDTEISSLKQRLNSTEKKLDEAVNKFLEFQSLISGNIKAVKIQVFNLARLCLIYTIFDDELLIGSSGPVIYKYRDK